MCCDGSRPAVRPDAKASTADGTRQETRTRRGECEGLTRSREGKPERFLSNRSPWRQRRRRRTTKASTADGRMTRMKPPSPPRSGGEGRAFAAPKRLRPQRGEEAPFQETLAKTLAKTLSAVFSSHRRRQQKATKSSAVVPFVSFCITGSGAKGGFQDAFGRSSANAESSIKRSRQGPTAGLASPHEAQYHIRLDAQKKLFGPDGTHAMSTSSPYLRTFASGLSGSPRSRSRWCPAIRAIGPLTRQGTSVVLVVAWVVTALLLGVVATRWERLRSWWIIGIGHRGRFICRAGDHALHG